MFAPVHVLAVGLLMAATSGCTLLDLLLGGPGPFDPDATFDPNATFPIPSSAAAFSSGTATIKVGSETIVLDELAGTAGSDIDLGLHVVWENDEGWYLSFYSYGGGAGFPGGSYLSIDRVADHEHFVIADPSRCLTTTSKADTSGVQGSATCRGLLWADYFAAYSGAGFPQPLPSQAPFDAEITFQAQ